MKIEGLKKVCGLISKLGIICQFAHLNLHLKRASAFNKHRVNEHFDNLAKAIDANKFCSKQIFNVDETRMTTVQNPKNVVRANGTRNVGSITSGQMGELVIAL